MGAAFVAILWIVIFLASIAIWTLTTAIAFWAWKRSSCIIAVCFSIPSFLIGVSGLMFAGLIVYGFIASFNPMTAYSSFIDETPGPEVSDVKSSVYWFADTGSVYIAFSIEEKDLRRLIPPEMKECSWEELQCKTMESGAGMPSWWRIGFNDHWIYFLRNERQQGKLGKRGFSSEIEYYAYDRRESRAYFRFLGID